MGFFVKLLLLFSVASLVLALESLNDLQDLQDRSLDDKWKTYMQKHGKTYESKAEESRRRQIYESNMKNIIEKAHQLQGLQGRKQRFSMGANALTDMTKEERKQLKQLIAPQRSWSRWNSYHNTGNGGSSSSEDYYDESTTTTKNPTNSNGRTRKPSNSIKSSVPDSVDYRNDSCMSPIKNQGKCGSCYAYAAIACVEWQACKQSGTNKLYSEQQLVDCSTKQGNYGCNGGFYTYAWTYMKKTPDRPESAYPYKGRKGICKPRQLVKKKDGIKVSSFTELPSLDEVALKESTAKIGPIAVAVDASPTTFDFYTEGIYDDKSCANVVENGDTLVNHAVVVVGYGTANGTDFWIIRNSWGNTWGMAGYMYLLRGNNTCNVGTYPAYPTL